MRPDLVAAVLERDGNRCTECGSKPSAGNTLDVYYLVPVRSGGTDEPENCATLCRRCLLEMD